MLKLPAAPINTPMYQAVGQTQAMTQPWVMWFQQLYAITGPQVDDVIPSVLLSLDMTASSQGDFVAKWADPAVGANTLFEIAEEYSTVKTSEANWITNRVGGCLRWGYTNTLRGSSPNTSYYFRFAARNNSNKTSSATGPGGAGMSLAGELGWGPWIYSGNTVTMGSATLISSGQVTMTVGNPPGGTGFTIDSNGIRGYTAGVNTLDITSGGILYASQLAMPAAYAGWLIVRGRTDAINHILLETAEGTELANCSFVSLQHYESGVSAGQVTAGTMNTVRATINATGTHFTNGGMTNNGISKLGDGGSTNYAEVAADGELLLHGTARVTKNLTFGLAGIGKGATAPAETRLGNTFGWAFTIGDDGYFGTEMPYDWDPSTAVEIKLHLYTNEAYATRSGEVRFKVDWSAVAEDVDEVVDSPTHSGTLTGSDMNISATAKGLQEYNVGSIAAASLAFEDCIFFNIERIALTAGTNPVAEPVILAIEMEYIANTLGEAT